MTQTQVKKIFSLSRNKKIKLVQALWDDIAREDTKTPKEHIELLETRISRIKSGKTKFKKWDDVVKKYFEKK